LKSWETQIVSGLTVKCNEHGQNKKV
jgi:hypothetical protein